MKVPLSDTTAPCFITCIITRMACGKTYITTDRIAQFPPLQRLCLQRSRSLLRVQKVSCNAALISLRVCSLSTHQSSANNIQVSSHSLASYAKITFVGILHLSTTTPPYCCFHLKTCSMQGAPNKYPSFCVLIPPTLMEGETTAPKYHTDNRYIPS